jgi:uncharacterized membrane protein YgaE (UPF0421/DUF939 family)
VCRGHANSRVNSAPLVAAAPAAHPSSCQHGVMLALVIAVLVLLGRADSFNTCQVLSLHSYYRNRH